MAGASGCSSGDGSAEPCGRADAARCAATASVSLERLARAGAARAAARADAELELQLLERAAAVVDGGGDGAVRNPVADANDHVATVMRMIHICKPRPREG